MCGKTTKVIFEPEPGRKVYCKPCLKKIQAQSGGKPETGPAASKNDENVSSRESPIAPVARPQAAREDPSPIRRTSLADLAHAQPVRFAGQKNDSQISRPKKEVQMDDLKKALSEALGAAVQKKDESAK